DAGPSAERIPRWFLPVSGDLKDGGRYQLEGNAGGTVERCDRPESFAVTWEFGGAMSWVRVTLFPDGEHTTLELAHEASLPPGMWEQFGPGATGVGWALGLRGLGRYLEAGTRADRATAVPSPASPEGAEFIRQAAAGWADAAVKDGAEAGAAHEAAMRTAAFYTTPPEAAPGTQMRGVLGALGEPVRRLILELLAAGEQPVGPLVTALQSRMPISQPAVSQ